MSKLMFNKVVEVPQDQVWDLVGHRFASIYKFHPAVKNSYLISGSPEFGVGAERVMEFSGGHMVREIVREYVEGDSLVVEAINSSLPVESFRASFFVRPQSINKTVVFIEVEFEARGLYKVVQPIMKGQIRYCMMRWLKYLEYYAKTGENIHALLPEEREAAFA